MKIMKSRECASIALVALMLIGLFAPLSYNVGGSGMEQTGDSSSPSLESTGTSSEDDFLYSVSDMNATITGYVGAGSIVIIPAIIDEYNVVSIGASAFTGNANITFIIVSSNVTSIGNSAFSGCTALTNVIMGSGVTTIGSNAFQGCTALTRIDVDAANTAYASVDGVLYNKAVTSLVLCPLAKSGSVTIPDTVISIGANAFQGHNALTTVIIGSGVITIGSYAFQGCSALTNVVIGNNVTSIGSYAFQSCTALITVTIPDKVTSAGLGTYAFQSCTALTAVTIGNGITVVGNTVFSSCNALTTVNLGSKVTSIGTAFSSLPKLASFNVDAANTAYASVDGVLYNKALTSLVLCPLAKSGSIIIPDALTSIGANVFKGRTALTSVIIGNGVTSIGANAFQGCTALITVTIGSHVTSIGANAFSGCTALTSINVDAANTAYASVDGVLYNKAVTSLILCPLAKSGSVIIPDTVTTIGDYAFQGCTALTDIVFGSDITSIGNYAFQGCTALTDIVFGSDITSIGNYAFQGCTALTTVTIPDKVTSLGTNVFQGCTALTTVVIGSGVTSIGANAFQGCTALISINVDAANSQYASLEGILYNKSLDILIKCPMTKSGSVIIPDTVTTIGDYAFQGCTGLTSVVIGNNVASIGQRAFQGCTGLTSVVIPDNVAYIKGQAFSDCTSLTTITVGSGIITINNDAFDGCNALTSITVDAASTHYASFDGILYDKGLGMLIKCPEAKSGTVTLPESINQISRPGFEQCTRLTSVILDSHLSYIDTNAFWDCTSLTTMIFKGNAPSTPPYQWTNMWDSITMFYYPGATGFSDEAWWDFHIYPLGDIPTLPNGLEAIPGDGNVTLKWSAPSYAGDFAIDHYVIFQDGVQVCTTESTTVIISGLVNGQMYSFAVAAHNSAGNGYNSTVVSVRPMSVWIDSPIGGSILNVDDITVQWTFYGNVTDISHVWIALDDGDPVSIASSLSSYELTGLSDGIHRVNITVEDSQGNVVYDEVTFIVDIAAPGLTISSPASDALLGSGPISLVFNAGDATSIQVSIDGGAWTTIPNAAYALDLGDGPHTVALRVYDGAGNMNETSVAFVVDTVLPSVSISSPTDDASISTAALDVYFSAGDASGIASLVLTLDGTIVDVKGTASHHLSALSQGTHVLNLTATDAAGNIAWQEISFTVDTIAPTIMITSPAANAVLDDGAVTVQFTAGDASTVQASVDGGAWMTIPNAVYHLTLGDGSHNVALRAYDAVGNMNETMVTFTIDDTAPTVATSSPNGSDVDLASKVSVLFSEGMNRSSVSVKINGVASTGLSWNGNLLTVSPALVGNTEYTVEVSGKDLAGNELVTVSWSFTTTDVSTFSGIIKDADGNPVAHAVVTLTNDNGEYSAVTGSDGSYSIANVPSGDYTITVTKDGYSTYTKTVTVEIGGTSASEATLEKNGGSDALLLAGIAIVAAIVVITALLIMRKRKIGGGKEEKKEIQK
jgi:hypothetical protein